jgi:hypothetical protein
MSKPKSEIDLVFNELPPMTFTISEEAFSPQGRENLIHYLTGSQQPWIDQPAEKADFLLRRELIKIYRVTPDGTPATWRDLVGRAQTRAEALRAQATRGGQLFFFSERVRPHESKQQIEQRVWLAWVMYSLGKRGLSFLLDGGIIANDNSFGGATGAAPDDLLAFAASQQTDNFYVGTYAERLRDDGDYPVELAKGRGRMRWYVHQVRIEPDARVFLNIEPEPTQRRIALVVAGEEHSNGPALPRDYYRSPAFQQAVIDAEDGNFDMTLVLSPRYHVITLDQVVQDDHPWEDISSHSPWLWSINAADRLWQICLKRSALPLNKEIPGYPRSPSWQVWRHPESRYEFTIFGLSLPAHILSETLSESATVKQRPGYAARDIELAWEDEDFIDELIGEDMHETLVEASEQAAHFSQLFFMPAPPGLEMQAYAFTPEEALEPVMVLRTRECDIDMVLDEAETIYHLLDGDAITINVLMDAPIRLAAVLDIIHAILLGTEPDIQELSLQVMPPILHELVENIDLPQLDRLDPLMTFAAALSRLATLLDDDDRDRLNVWQRSFWAAEMRHLKD